MMVLSNRALYEIEVQIQTFNSHRILCGVIDCYDPESNTVWEFKTVGKPEKHILQLIFYAYIIKCGDCSIQRNAKFKYLNMTNGEVISISDKLLIRKSIRIRGRVSRRINSAPKHIKSDKDLREVR